MKTLNQDEVDALNRVAQDVDITIDSKFSFLSDNLSQNLKSLTPIFVGLYFKSVNHDPRNKDWKNKDRVFALNNYSNIVKNIVKLHAGYGDFNNLEEYLLEYDFVKVENTIAEAIGHAIASRDLEDRHERYYYVVCSELDLINNLSQLDFIIKNKLKKIVILAYTGTDREDINKENKLNGRLINLGFDTLLLSIKDPSNVYDAITYAKKLDKPTIILSNIN